MMFTPDAFNYFQHDAANSAVPSPHFAQWGATHSALQHTRQVLEEAAREINATMLHTEAEIRCYFLDCTTSDNNLAQDLHAN